MQILLRKLIPDFDRIEKRLFLTHADVDHGGLMPLFDTIYVSRKGADSLLLESAGLDSYRERNPLHRPYIRICKRLTAYPTPEPEKIQVVCGDSLPTTELLTPVGQFRFGELCFDLLEGGGHLPGELILVEPKAKIAFTGDIYVNLKAMIPEQAEYNSYAPILMTAVDMDPALCTRQRKAFFAGLTPGDWRIFGAHGAPREHRAEAL